jgi:CubicO group peptidase (beta-lactamase class C family)
MITLVKKAGLILLLLSFAAAPAAWAHEDEPHHPTSLAELEEGLLEIIWEGGVPGLSVAVVENGELVWTAGLGVIDREERTRASADSVFRVGSISKTFVSLAVMKLVEEGRLSLDDRLADLAPEVEFTNPWETTHPVRLIHLLEHTSGFDDIHLREYAYQDPDISLRDGLAYNPRSRTSRWQPGSFFSYSNSGPAAAAYVVEKVTGQRFEDYAQENIFAPLGMTHTSYLLRPDLAEHLSKSYGLNGGEIPYSHIIVRPSGAIISTPADMGRLLIFFIERGQVGGHTWLQPQTVALIETPQASLAAQQGLRYGYGKANFTSIYEGFVFHGHDGGIDGFVASFGYLPEHRSGYYVSINGGSASIEPVIDLIRSYLTRDLEPPPPPERSPSAADLEKYAGYYEAFTPRIEMLRFIERITGTARVEVSGEGLVLRPILGGLPQTLLPVSEALFRTPGDPLATLAFGEHPEHGTVLMGAAALGGNLRAAPAWTVTGRTLAAASVTLLLFSSLLYALVWVPLWIFRPSRRTPHASVRLLPLLASLALLGALILLVAGFIAGIETLGTPTFYSVGLFLLSLLFALLSLAAVVQALRALRISAISWPVRLHSLLVALALLLAAVYLTVSGFVGIRTWL